MKRMSRFAEILGPGIAFVGLAWVLCANAKRLEAAPGLRLLIYTAFVASFFCAVFIQGRALTIAVDMKENGPHSQAFEYILGSELVAIFALVVVYAIRGGRKPN